MICLFEDSKAEQFYPLSLTRHVSDLLVGTQTLRARALSFFSNRALVLHGRQYIREYYRDSGFSVNLPTGTALYLNAALLVDQDLVDQLPSGERWVLMAGERVAAAQLSADDARRLNWEADALDFSLLPDLPRYDANDAVLYEYLWDIIAANPSLIAADFQPQALSENLAAPGVHVLNPELVAIHPDVTLKPGVVIDATDGPVIVESGTAIMANSVIEGPCYVGPHCRIKIGAKIYEGSSFGPWCKVGGEVENSIMVGYANKQHDGFLGHSYIGRWVNLGADTNTSDLKNNYGAIRVKLNGQDVETHRRFLGALIGDHSKTGINTMLNTGTVVGASANVFGGGFPPKEIPSFAWGGAGGFQKFQLEKAIELADRVMARRNVVFTEADNALLRYIHASLSS